MSNRQDFYFREIVSESELDAGFADLEQADLDQALDWDMSAAALSSLYGGILRGLVPSAPGGVTSRFTIGTAYDDAGRRIRTTGTLDVDLSQTGDTAIGAGGTPTGGGAALPAPGFQRYASVFLVFDRLLSDPRVDGTGATVYFDRAESFHFSVKVGTSVADPGPPVAKPPLEAGKLLLVDFIISDTAILSTDTSRRQVWLRRADTAVPTTRVGTGFPIRGLVLGTESDASPPHGIRLAIEQLLGYYNDHVRNDASAADKHTAVNLTAIPTDTWAGAEALTYATVQAGLDEIVADLADAVGTDGATRVGAVAVVGAPTSLLAGSIRSQLNELLVGLNAHLNDADDAHAASAIGYAGGGAWADAGTNPATTVELQLDKVISDLAATVAPDGAGRIGARLVAGVLAFPVAADSLAAGTLQSQIAALLAAVNGRVLRGGDVISGDLLPNAAGTVNVGTGTIPFLGVGVRNLLVTLQGDAVSNIPLAQFRGRGEATDALVVTPMGGLQHRQTYWHDDFLVRALDSTEKYRVVTGAGGTAVVLTDGDGAEAIGGVLRVASVDTDVVGTSCNTAKLFNLNVTPAHMFARAKLLSASVNQTAKIGFRNGEEGGETAYVYFKNSGANWVGIVKKAAGGENVTAAIMAIDTNYHKFEIRFRGNSTVDFVIDDTTIQTIAGVSADSTFYEWSAEMQVPAEPGFKYLVIDSFSVHTGVL